MKRWRGGPIFHVRKGVPYHVENSITGMNMAVRGGYSRIDLDAQITLDNDVVITHWPRPMLRDGFRDPSRMLSHFRTVSSMTLAQVRRLRTRQGHQIRAAWFMFAEASSRGLVVELEVKRDRRFEDVDLMRSLFNDAVAEKCVVQVMTLSNDRHAGARLKAAQQAGFTTVLLAHTRWPIAWEPYVDYVRGRYQEASR